MSQHRWFYSSISLIFLLTKGEKEFFLDKSTSRFHAENTNWKVLKNRLNVIKEAIL